MLRAAQAEWKATLDAGRADPAFTAGDRVLPRTKELLDAADIARMQSCATVLISHGFQGGQLDFYCHNLDSCSSGRGFQVTARQESVFQWIRAQGLEL